MDYSYNIYYKKKINYLYNICYINMIKDLYKKDTILAFIISFILFYIFTRKAIKGLLFSTLFVIIFLIFLNYII